MSRRIVIGMTGATGQVFGIRALEVIAASEHESHLVLSNAARITIQQETSESIESVLSLADQVYEIGNIGAEPASGSFRTAGQLIVPCSMKTLSNVAHGNAGNLITRSADVTLKERRPLVLMPREKPFNRIHLENMLAVTDAGAIVLPPFLSFYQADDSLDEMITRTVKRALSHLDGVDFVYDEWDGL